MPLYGCHVDLAKENGGTIYRNCVLDYGKPEDCTWSEKLRIRTRCKHWHKVKKENEQYYEPN
jgi:hypothetical protein